MTSTLCCDSLDQALNAVSRSFGQSPAAVFQYFSCDGVLVGLVCRWNQPDGKAIRPLALDLVTGQWCRKAMPSPRPLFHLPELLAAPLDVPVWLCEGEPAAEALSQLLLQAGRPDIAITWSGGCSAWRQTDFSPLRGRLVRLWPDNDQAGKLAMREVAAYLAGLGCRLEWIDPADRFQMPDRADAVDVARQPQLLDCTTAAEIVDTLASLARPPELNALDRGEFPTGLDGRADAELLKRKPVSGPLTAALSKPQPSTAERLVALALERYRMGQTEDGAAFAEALERPGFVRLLRGGDSSLRAELARGFRDVFGRPPSASALADALAVLEGEALAMPRQPVWLRVAPQPDGLGVVLDLGRADGRVVVIEPGEWRISDGPPSGVLFRRTALTGELPLPQRGGLLDGLAALLNVSRADWPLIVGWLVAALLPQMPHPVLLLTGLQGVGKTTAARLLVGLVDPGPVPVRSEPRDLDGWLTAAAGSWTIALDNLSGLPSWLSDALCRAATGDGLVKRRLYSDGDLHIIALKRVVLLTAIDPGCLRGDLGDRLVAVELEPLADAARRPEADLEVEYTAARPVLLGALLDALAAALNALPRVQVRELPRMADFGRLLAALDLAGATDRALPRYMGMRSRVDEDVVEGDPFAVGILELLGSRSGFWSGTASQLLTELRPDGSRPPPGWPSPNRVAGRLKRLIPALQSRGIEVGICRTRSGRLIDLRCRPPRDDR